MIPLLLRGGLLVVVAAAVLLLPPCLSTQERQQQSSPPHSRLLQSNSNDENALLSKIKSHLSPLESAINSKLFLVETPSGDVLPSKVYIFKDFLAALPVVADGEGIANKYFYLGEQQSRGYEYGLVNIAAFLAQCMKETIKYDACDENNWDSIDGLYPVANACGQLKQSYQDYKCQPDEEFMECPIDPNMKIKATTNAKWWGAPAPLFCAPKSEYPFVGVWNMGYSCDNKWANPPESCEEYDGQKSGGFDHSVAVPSKGGRTDVEACCWWGRGVIQMTGVCNFGKLNYFIGARAAAEGRESKYPSVDFCKTPEAICSSEEHPELKWISGFFYWMQEVQEYDKDGWSYMSKLSDFVNGGMKDRSFIDSVSGIVNRGCHNPPCATGSVEGLEERQNNFQQVLKVFRLPSSGGSPGLTASLGSNSTPSFSSSLLNQIIHSLYGTKFVFLNYILTYKNTSGATIKSDVYTFDSLLESLAYAHEIGYAGKKFYIGDNRATTPSDFDTAKVVQEHLAAQNLAVVYGLVNIAAFLSQIVVESVQYNACDNVHPSDSFNAFPGSLYTTEYTVYKCPVDEIKMECPETAANEATGIGGLMTKGNCMLGKLNYYLGGAYEVDFCNPADICQNQRVSHPSIVYDIALFEWVERIQSFDENGFNYLDELHKFVDGGMMSEDFIVSVSKILTKGSLDGQGQIPNLAERQGQFYLMLKYLVKDSSPDFSPAVNSASQRVNDELLLLVLPLLLGMLLLSV